MDKPRYYLDDSRQAAFAQSVQAMDIKILLML